MPFCLRQLDHPVEFPAHFQTQPPDAVVIAALFGAPFQGLALVEMGHPDASPVLAHTAHSREIVLPVTRSRRQPSHVMSDRQIGPPVGVSQIPGVARIPAHNAPVAARGCGEGHPRVESGRAARIDSRNPADPVHAYLRRGKPYLPTGITPVDVASTHVVIVLIEERRHRDGIAVRLDKLSRDVHHAGVKRIAVALRKGESQLEFAMQADTPRARCDRRNVHLAPGNRWQKANQAKYE